MVGRSFIYQKYLSIIGIETDFQLIQVSLFAPYILQSSKFDEIETTIGSMLSTIEYIAVFIIITCLLLLLKKRSCFHCAV